MTFEEARQRSDYSFALNGIESDIEDIRNNYMKCFAYVVNLQQKQLGEIGEQEL